MFQYSLAPSPSTPPPYTQAKETYTITYSCEIESRLESLLETDAELRCKREALSAYLKKDREANGKPPFRFSNWDEERVREMEEILIPLLKGLEVKGREVRLMGKKFQREWAYEAGETVSKIRIRGFVAEKGARWFGWGFGKALEKRAKMMEKVGGESEMKVVSDKNHTEAKL